MLRSSVVAVKASRLKLKQTKMMKAEDLFSILHLPQQYAIDEVQLEENYRALQIKVHPDNFVNAASRATYSSCSPLPNVPAVALKKEKKKLTSATVKITSWVSDLEFDPVADGVELAATSDNTTAEPPQRLPRVSPAWEEINCKGELEIPKDISNRFFVTSSDEFHPIKSVQMKKE